MVRELLGKGNVNETMEKLQTLTINLIGGYSVSEDGVRPSFKDVVSPSHLATILENQSQGRFNHSNNLYQKRVLYRPYAKRF